jgi:UDP-N-acetylmuramate: L-alanyl-gamma-D-glutamyl-meso-diaminopimelate ligase
MDKRKRSLDIYLMGIGGTGMGAFAGLLKQDGHRVFGSDHAIYSPMKEKLLEWGISFCTPYSTDNLPDTCDLVIVGNVIKKDNQEARAVLARKLPYESFPRALNTLFLKNAVPIVASGTHGKTTCSALLAHTLFNAGFDPGFLIGGIPINFGDSFRIAQKIKSPFVVEGDEYDTAFFDKRPKFIHYDPKFLLVTSLEFDHADIYRDLDAVIDAFADLMKTLTPGDVIIINGQDNNIKTALLQAKSPAMIVSYGKDADYEATACRFEASGLFFTVRYKNTTMGDVFIPLFGEHNLSNALGCYALLHRYGLSHAQIEEGFRSFLGVKRRLEEKLRKGTRIVVDDFAHHPSAVKETIKAVRQKYPRHKICTIFEPRSATSCMKIFESLYQEAFLLADKVMLAPVGRDLPENERLDTKKIAHVINQQGINARAFFSYNDLRMELAKIEDDFVLLFMSNGDFHGLLEDIDRILS